MATKLDVTIGYADVNDGRLYFESAGDGDSIVFVHAGIADSRMWNPQYPDFATDHLVTRYDMRGYGESSLQQGEFCHARDLYALLSLLGIKHTVLVGCSMGGSTCMDFAMSYSHMVRGLVMVCSDPPGFAPDREKYPPPPAWNEAVAAFEAGDLERTSEKEVEVWVDGPNRTSDQVDPAVRELVYEMNLKVLQNEVAAVDAKETLLNPDDADRLESFEVPTLVIIGDQDQALVQFAADEMATRIPNAKKVVIKNAAHLPNLEHPDAFTKAVRDWLKKLD